MTHVSRGCTRRGLIRSLVGGSLLLPGILSQLLADDAAEPHEKADPLTPKKPHFEPKAKRVIFLFSPGGVSHVDTFDYKPKLVAMHMKPCPDELLKNQRFAFIKGHPKLLELAEFEARVR